ncbi:MAG: M48 family metallopeptidase [Candidatus Caenarcaniphilales bacterium]|nr:M48 family metallopeptidase [Candidatus Caenarcaniphilales bacterium]
MWEQIEKNKFKTTLLILSMGVLFVALGFTLGSLFSDFTSELGYYKEDSSFNQYELSTPMKESEINLYGGLLGVLIALIGWGLLTITTYFAGDKIVLWSAKARHINHQNHPILFNVVEEMCIASGLERIPNIHIIDEPAPNAFAIGKDQQNASIAITKGLLTKLNRYELQGVIAHEIAHIQNRDTLLMTTLGTMLGVIVFLGEISWKSAYISRYRKTSSSRDNNLIILIALLLGILAPIFAQIIYYATSRTREYLADACAVQYTRYPEGLANALEKITGSTEKLSSANKVTAAMFIVNPLKLTSQGLADLSSTHPPTSKRIQILRSLTNDVSFKSYNQALNKTMNNSSNKTMGVIPVSALQEEEILIDEHIDLEDDNELNRTREISNMFWGLNNFIFIPCNCGTNLKIPEEYRGLEIECPHCEAKHMVSL